MSSNEDCSPKVVEMAAQVAAKHELPELTLSAVLLVPETELVTEQEVRLSHQESTRPYTDNSPTTHSELWTWIFANSCNNNTYKNFSESGFIGTVNNFSISNGQCVARHDYKPNRYTSAVYDIVLALAAKLWPYTGAIPIDLYMHTDGCINECEDVGAMRSGDTVDCVEKRLCGLVIDDTLVGTFVKSARSKLSESNLCKLIACALDRAETFDVIIRFEAPQTFENTGGVLDEINNLILQVINPSCAATIEVAEELVSGAVCTFTIYNVNSEQFEGLHNLTVIFEAAGWKCILQSAVLDTIQKMFALRGPKVRGEEKCSYITQRLQGVLRSTASIFHIFLSKTQVGETPISSRQSVGTYGGQVANQADVTYYAADNSAQTQPIFVASPLDFFNKKYKTNTSFLPRFVGGESVSSDIREAYMSRFLVENKAKPLSSLSSSDGKTFDEVAEQNFIFQDLYFFDKNAPISMVYRRSPLEWSEQRVSEFWSVWSDVIIAHTPNIVDRNFGNEVTAILELAPLSQQLKNKLKQPYIALTSFVITKFLSRVVRFEPLKGSTSTVDTGKVIREDMAVVMGNAKKFVLREAIMIRDNILNAGAAQKFEQLEILDSWLKTTYAAYLFCKAIEVSYGVATVTHTLNRVITIAAKVFLRPGCEHLQLLNITNCNKILMAPTIKMNSKSARMDGGFDDDGGLDGKLQHPIFGHFFLSI